MLDTRIHRLWASRHKPLLVFLFLGACFSPPASLLCRASSSQSSTLSSGLSSCSTDAKNTYHQQYLRHLVNTPLAMCSRHRGGGRNLRVPPCFVPCRAVPPMGGGGQRGLVPCRAKCSYPTRSFVEAHMYQWFRFGRHVALFRDCCICNFLCVVSWCCTMCFPTHS